MRRGNLLVFDEYVSNTATLTTNQELNAVLGQYDQLAIFAVVDNFASSGTLTVGLWHSGDGRNWVQKSTPISAATFSTAVPALVGTDPVGPGASTPSLGLVQLVIGVSVAAHVRIHVTTRDPSQ
jgi:hypothetical protein